MYPTPFGLCVCAFRCVGHWGLLFLHLLCLGLHLFCCPFWLLFCYLIWWLVWHFLSGVCHPRRWAAIHSRWAKTDALLYVALCSLWVFWCFAHLLLFWFFGMPWLFCCRWLSQPLCFCLAPLSPTPCWFLGVGLSRFLKCSFLSLVLT